MEKIYMKLIMLGKKTLSDIPERWRENVAAALEKQNEDR
ncbi:MAG: CD1375 family protein [Oscillospiraceae bacterium]